MSFLRKTWLLLAALLIIMIMGHASADGPVNPYYEQARAHEREAIDCSLQTRSLTMWLSSSYDREVYA